MPAWAAMARAVRGGGAGDHHHANARLAALRNGLGHLGAQRVGQGHQTQPLKVKVVLGVGPGVLRAVPCLGHAQHPQAPVGQACGLGADGGALGVGQVAKVGHGFRRALGGHRVVRRGAVAPQVAHGQQLGRKLVFARQ